MISKSTFQLSIHVMKVQYIRIQEYGSFCFSVRNLQIITAPGLLKFQASSFSPSLRSQSLASNSPCVEWNESMFGSFNPGNTRNNMYSHVMQTQNTSISTMNSYVRLCLSKKSNMLLYLLTVLYIYLSKFLAIWNLLSIHIHTYIHTYIHTQYMIMRMYTYCLQGQPTRLEAL